MALPRTIIRLMRPYVVVLSTILIFVAYQHYASVKDDALKQTQANLRTASKLIQAQLKNSVNIFSSLNRSAELEDPSAANLNAVDIIRNTENYNDILRYDPSTNSAISETAIFNASMYNTDATAFDMQDASWTDISFMDNRFQISSLYRSQNRRWVVGLRETNPAGIPQYIIEFDLMYASQAFIDLRTLNSGNVFIVDRATGKVILHPNPNRIGEMAVVYKYSIAGELSQDERTQPVSYYFSDTPSYAFNPDSALPNKQLYGSINYFFHGDAKLASYNARNSMNWIYFSSISRSDLFAHSYSVLLIGFVALSLLLFVSIFHYLNKQLQVALADLSKATTLLEFKKQVQTLLERFCTRRRVQLCLYNHESQTFYTVDYHGQEQSLLIDKEYALDLLTSEVKYQRSGSQDPLAKQIQFSAKYYRVPLHGHNGLTGVIFLESRFQTFPSLMKLLQNFIETSLSNVLFQQQVLQRDATTNQDNLFTLRNKISRYKGHRDVYLLTIDVDDLKLINYKHGYTCGDQLILEMSSVISKHFPASSTLSTARTGGDEFCVLYHAVDQQHAFSLAENLREAIERHKLVFDTVNVNFTVSIGVSHLRDSVDKTLSSSLQATDRGKQNGKNLAIMSAAS
ncbi:diguanylate cyclase [Vibrio breoganii]|nr:diguanylate cyclase [Vibrio breoganii]